MNPSADARIENRLEALEVKASFAEDAWDRLNEVVVRQQRQLDQLIQEVARLRHQHDAAPDPAGLRSLRDELPPHY